LIALLAGATSPARNRARGTDGRPFCKPIARDPGTCPTLTAGSVYKLLTTTGSLTGTFGNVANGKSITIGATDPCSQPTLSAQINYTASEVIATLHKGTSLPVPPSVPAPRAAPPILGKTETAQVLAGQVSVRVKGTSRFIALSGATSIPDKSELDTTNGRVLITAAAATPGQTHSAEVYAGRFVVHQSRTHLAMTHLALSQPLNDEIRARFVPDVPDGYVPLNEAARILGYARQTVLHKVQRGELPAVQVTQGQRKGLRIKAPNAQPDQMINP
jgi:hypothetical protein